MSEKIVIASDSTTDLSTELIKEYSVKILPLGVSLSGKQYLDGEINPDIIYDNYEKTGELPKTSAVNISEFADFFKESTSNGSSVILFTISSDMSSTYNNAKLAAQDFENVHVVDTRNLSTGGGLLVILAAEEAKKGKSAAEIAELCKQTADRVDASFVLDNLEFLYKGGRCSALAALGANLLQLKPCITVSDGKMGVDKKYRGKFESTLKNYIKDRLGDGSGIEPNHVFITHAGCDEKLYNQCVCDVKDILPNAQVHITRAGCTISSHCGKNTLGVLFIRKKPM